MHHETRAVQSLHVLGLPFDGASTTLVSIHGPFPDLDTAKRLQAEQAAYAKSAGEAFKAELQGTSAGSPAGKASG